MTCMDCIHYNVCEMKDEKVSLGTKVEELVADNFTCFKNKADFVEVVRCGKCKYFTEYSDQHKQKVEKADGDCFFKLMYCYDKQFIACRYNDFCSFGERKENE